MKLMKFLLMLLAVMAAAPTAGFAAAKSKPAETHEAVSSIDQVVTNLAPRMQTGTLLFSKGDCLAVKVFTASPYTHVATVVMINGQPIVYDSMNGVGVRKQPLKEYLEYMAPDVIYVMQPSEPMVGVSRQCYIRHLESQLGQPYAIMHHLTGQRAKGQHCSEYITDALSACQWIEVKRPPRVSPASLRTGLVDGEVYSPTQTLQIVRPVADEPPAPTRLGRFWQNTKVCTSTACFKLKRVICCK